MFPDLQQILDNNTNADTGSCPPGPIAQPVPQASTECYSEFLPTSDYVGVAGVNADPLALHMRFTARDGIRRRQLRGHDAPAREHRGAVPGDLAEHGRLAARQLDTDRDMGRRQHGRRAGQHGDVRISLSVDSGHTYPYVLAASTPNTGSASVDMPMVGTTHARVKIEAVGNVFFDVSNADFAITWPFLGFFSPIGAGVNPAKAGSAVPVKFSLGGDRGLAILADGYPASVQVEELRRRARADRLGFVHRLREQRLDVRQRPVQLRLEDVQGLEWNLSPAAGAARPTARSTRRCSRSSREPSRPGARFRGRAPG